MNYLMWLLAGIIVGWVIEWIIDWLFWRRAGGKAEAASRSVVASDLAATGKAHEQALADLQLEVDRLKAQLAERDRLAAQAEMEMTQPGTRLAGIASTQVSIPPASPVHRDRLEEINGIGPAFAARLNKAGIYSFAQLSQLTPQGLIAIINPANWQKIDAESWIAQATAMASPDPLEDIVGIGPEYAHRLNEAGIYTFAELARLTPERLREIIDPDEWQKIEPASWIAQAKEFAAKKTLSTTGGE